MRKEGEDDQDFAVDPENQMQYSVLGADDSFAVESDEEEVHSISPIEGVISADKRQNQSNTTDIRPIPASEEEEIHNIPEIQESILAGEEQSEGTGIQKDDDDSDL
jgi:hypothetical protein